MNYTINELNKIIQAIIEQTYIPGQDIDNLIYEAELGIAAFENLKEDLIKLRDKE